MKYTCGIFLISKDDLLLIAHPTNAAHDVWSIPKGLKDEGEPSNVAAARELEEETSIKISSNELIYFAEGVIYPNKKKTLLPFLYKSDVMSWEYDLVCESMVHQANQAPFPENDEFAWATLEEAKKLLHSTQVACLEDLKKFLIPKNINDISKRI